MVKRCTSTPRTGRNPTAPTRAQAKSIDATFGGTGLEDTTPAERRYVVGAKVTGEGVLDRRTGILTVTFARRRSPTTTPPTRTESSTPRPSRRWAPGDPRGVDESEYSPRDSPRRRGGAGLLQRRGARFARTRWRRRSCGNTPDVPAASGFAPRTWNFPRISTSSSAGSTRGTPRLGVLRRPAPRVRMGAGDGRGDGDGSSNLRPARRRRVSTFELEASRADGAWDGEIAWRLVSVDPSRWPGVPRVDPSDLGPLNATVAAANADGATRLNSRRAPSSTRRAFAADVTSCDGTVTNATFTTRRKRGPVPNSPHDG